MAFYNKLYSFQKHEKFDAWLKHVGVPESRIEAFLADQPTFKIVQSGDSYTVTRTSSKENKEVTFKSGVEFDERSEGGDAMKTSYTVSGNTVTQLIKSPRGAVTFKWEFDGDNLNVTVTSDSYDGVAKAFYKA